MSISDNREREKLYDYIIGTVEYVSPQYIVVENNEIGYQIFTPNPYIFPQNGQKQKVYTYFHVREDTNALYGFKTLETKIFFTKLINVSGIGPKGALAILAAGEPLQIAQAIEDENEKYLVKFPGVGKKTARQIILDLKGNLQEFLTEYAGVASSEKKVMEENHELTEALLALEALGYSPREIKKIVPLIENEKLATDQYIKLALQKLTKM